MLKGHIAKVGKYLHPELWLGRIMIDIELVKKQISAARRSIMATIVSL